MMWRQTSNAFNTHIDMKYSTHKVFVEGPNLKKMHSEARATKTWDDSKSAAREGIAETSAAKSASCRLSRATESTYKIPTYRKIIEYPIAQVSRHTHEQLNWDEL